MLHVAVCARGGLHIVSLHRYSRGEAPARSAVTRSECSGGEHVRYRTHPDTEATMQLSPGRDTNAAASASAEIERLERAFWQSLVDRDADAARGMLAPEALMVSSHGTMRFDPAQYEKMLLDPKHGLLEYTLSDMDVLFPSDDVAIATYRAHQKMEMDGQATEQDVVDTSTWVRAEGGWKCAAHTESEARSSTR
jgi:ketosteroid isomerase-like protein